VITRPDTPQSWSNYLGTTEYGAIITNHAGGYGFYKSGAQGRFLRLRFNSIPMDQPGRYFYIRDQASGDYWSASWQPVAKPLLIYDSICRHGTGYTIIESKYADIRSQAAYYVPLGETFEYWRLKLTNESDRPRTLAVFSFCEFTNNWDTRQDTVNLQYSLFIVKGQRLDNGLLRIAIHDNLIEQADDDPVAEGDLPQCTWMGLVGAPVAGHDTNREAFLGTYGGYQNPHAVESGRCSDSDAYGDNACGTLQTELTLQPGESREVMILLGIGDARTTGVETMETFGSFERADSEFEKLKQSWHAKLGQMVVDTPDEELKHTFKWYSFLGEPRSLRQRGSVINECVESQ